MCIGRVYNINNRLVLVCILYISTIRYTLRTTVHAYARFWLCVRIPVLVDRYESACSLSSLNELVSGSQNAFIKKNELVSGSQNAFIKKCCIHDNFVYVQSVIKALHINQGDRLSL